MGPSTPRGSPYIPPPPLFPYWKGQGADASRSGIRRQKPPILYAIQATPRQTTDLYTQQLLMSQCHSWGGALRRPKQDLSNGTTLHGRPRGKPKDHHRGGQQLTAKATASVGNKNSHYNSFYRSTITKNSLNMQHQVQIQAQKRDPQHTGHNQL